MTNINIYGLILDYLEVPPNSSMLEVGGNGGLFSSAAQDRDIAHSTSKGEDADWHFHILDAGLAGDVVVSEVFRTVMIVQSPISVWRYINLRRKFSINEIIRIKPETKESAPYMSSMAFWKTVRRTYHNADLNIIGKFLVALKVALKPANTYPIMVFVL
ncbi:MAG: hypothetical protein COB14_03550 [Alphaproteobacteria bacterium]|nr:MAG: hypothetical protein COB14_03550 [Alphaproteobacteria bacterium]